MKYAYVTTVCDIYFKGFLMTFNSILMSHKDFNHDLIIFECDNLSDQNKKTIQKLYNNVYFKKINKESYRNDVFDKSVRDWKDFKPTYRFDIFTLKEYEKILYFDCDIIFEIDMNHLLSDDDIKFGVSQMVSYSEYYQTKSNKIFNAGVMIIDNTFLGDNIKKDLIDLSKAPPPKNSKYEDKNWVGNQPILNNYFENKINWIDEKYNLTIDRLYKKIFLEKNNYHLIGSKKIWSDGDLYSRFDRHVINTIKQNQKNNEVNCIIILKKILEKYESVKLNLLEKDIII